MKRTLTIWFVWFIASAGAEAAGVQFNPFIAWPLLIITMMGLFYYQFVHGRDFPDDD